MASVNCDSLKTKFIDEDPNSLAFRRRNNAVIFIFLCFITTLALVLASSFFYILHGISDSNQLPPFSPAVKAYYSVASNIPSCLDMFMEIVSIKPDAEPDLIFDLTLHSAAKDLDITLDELVLPNSDTEPAYKNCSVPLRDGSGQIWRTLEALRVNPSVETMGGEERSEMVKWLVAAEENLNACLVDLWKGESTAVIDVRGKVLRVKAYLRSGEEFLERYDVVMRRFRGEIVAGRDHWRRKEVLKNLGILCLSGLYLCFLLCILRAICRFVGVKTPPLGNVFRSFFTGAVWRR